MATVDSRRQNVRNGMLAGKDSMAIPDFKRINKAQVFKLFNLYDTVFFDGQISEMLITTGSTLHFTLSGRTTGVLSECSSSGCKYTIEISPRVIADVVGHNSTIMGESKDQTNVMIYGCMDRLECLQYIFESDIVHLMMMLWGFHKKDNSEIYAPYGSLHKCVLKDVFERVSTGPILQIGTPPPTSPTVGTIIPPQQTQFGIFKNIDLSCYLDSLLMIMFAGKSKYYIDTIFNTDLDKKSWMYPDPITLELTLEKVCSGNSCVKTEGQLRSLAKKIQKQLLEDFTQVMQGKSFYCSRLRELLAKCFPNMKTTSGHWDTYNVSSIYAMLADIFPDLKMEYTGMIHYSDTTRQPRLRHNRQAMIQMWDFMDSHTNVENMYEVIDFDSMDIPVIVFQNGGTPPIRNFGSRGPETVGRGKTARVYQKARAFGETILGGKYELFGAVFIHGVPKHGRCEVLNNNAHYTSMFKNIENKWVQYDDMKSNVNILGRGLRPDFFDFTGKSVCPELFFYRLKRASSPVSNPGATAVAHTKLPRRRKMSKYTILKKPGPLGGRKLVIVVPYRNNPGQNREAQLQRFTTEIPELLKTVTNNFEIIIAEQTDDGKKFNRGKILNAAIDHYKKNRYPQNEPTYYILHDVDTIPGDRLLPYYGMLPKYPIHLGAGGKKYPYPDFLGIALSMTEEGFMATNGYPNNFWGWGGEDDELRKRIFEVYDTIWRPPIRDRGVEEMPHGWDPSEGISKAEKARLKKLHKTWRKNGINNVNYKIVNEKINARAHLIRYKLDIS